MAFAKSITNHGDAASKDCNLNKGIGNKAQGVYGLVIAPIVSKKLYAKARYDMYEANGKTDMMRTQYEVGLNYHINKTLPSCLNMRLSTTAQVQTTITQWQTWKFVSDSNI